MMKKIYAIGFNVLLAFILVARLVTPVASISQSERRPLQQLPKFSLEELVDGIYMKEFEKYALDQMPFRDMFRGLKAWTERRIFLKKLVNGLWIEDDYLLKTYDAPTEQEIVAFVKYIEGIREQYFSENATYITMIPDKSYYSSDKYWAKTETQIKQWIQEQLTEIAYIDIHSILELSDYYFTDTHWKQENLFKLVNYLATQLDTMETINKEKWIEKEFDNYTGVYGGQWALPVEAEMLKYMSHECFDNIRIINYQEQELMGQVYDEEKLLGWDGYEVFLSGGSPLIQIHNPEKDKELVIFGDSFSSSLVPLLIPQYGKITLIDTRYLPKEYIGDYVEFTGEEDVLFMYSSLILSNSQTLR
jgi:hypothetical protein